MTIKTEAKFIILFIALIYQSCNSNKTSLEISGLKNKVKEIKARKFLGYKEGEEIKIGEPTRYSHENYHLTYSKDGMLLKTIYLDASNKIDWQQTYNYDNNLNLFEIKHLDSYNDTTKTYRYSYQNNEVSSVTELDKNGRITSSQDLKPPYYEGEQVTKGYNLDGSTFNNYYKSKYNDKKQLIQMTQYDEDHELWLTRNFIYNDNGEMTESIELGPKNNEKLRIKYIYDYDDKGNWIKCIETHEPVEQNDNSPTPDKVKYYITIRTIEYFK